MKSGITSAAGVESTGLANEQGKHTPLLVSYLHACHALVAPVPLTIQARKPTHPLLSLLRSGADEVVSPGKVQATAQRLDQQRGAADTEEEEEEEEEEEDGDEVEEEGQAQRQQEAPEGQEDSQQAGLLAGQHAGAAEKETAGAAEEEPGAAEEELEADVADVG